VTPFKSILKCPLLILRTFKETQNGLKLGFGKSKQRDSPAEAATETLVANRLKELSGGDGDLYQTMSRLMFLDPKRITIPLDLVLSEARDYESHGNRLRAEVGYRIAGGISLYKGDVNGVNEYFSKAASFAGDTHPEYQMILKRSSEAVAVARKYYEEFSTLPT
jgi:hypothetical protein